MEGPRRRFAVAWPLVSQERTRGGPRVSDGLIAAALVGCQVASLVWRQIPTMGRAASVIVSRRPGRWLLLAGWLWIGWHLFVRSGVAA